MDSIERARRLIIKGAQPLLFVVGIGFFSAWAAPGSRLAELPVARSWELGWAHAVAWPGEPADGDGYAMVAGPSLARSLADAVLLGVELPVHLERWSGSRGWRTLAVGDPRLFLNLGTPAAAEGVVRLQANGGLRAPVGHRRTLYHSVDPSEGPEAFPASRRTLRWDATVGMTFDGRRSVSKLPLALLVHMAGGGGIGPTREWMAPGLALLMQPTGGFVWELGGDVLRYGDQGPGRGEFFPRARGGFSWQVTPQGSVRAGWTRLIGDSWQAGFPPRNQAYFQLHWALAPEPREAPVSDPYRYCPDQEGCPPADPDNDLICAPWVAEGGYGLRYASICRGKDLCPEVAGPGTEDGCPSPDPDGDGVCAEWVEKGHHSARYAAVCHGVDRCPEIPGPGSPDGCPVPDSDHDGVCDAWVSQAGYFARYGRICSGIDACPQLPGPGTADGCPVPDTDGDGICDPWVQDMGLSAQYEKVCKGRDLCPQHPENFNGFRDEDGCPDKSPAEERWERLEPLARKPVTGVLDGVRYHQNSLHMRPESQDAILQLARQMKAFPQVLIEIRGYTDDRGTSAENLVLGQQQAEGVLTQLLQLGVPPQRLRAVGAGSDSPLRSNRQVAGRFANRRVEIVVFEAQ